MTSPTDQQTELTEEPPAEVSEEDEFDATVGTDVRPTLTLFERIQKALRAVDEIADRYGSREDDGSDEYS